MIYQIVKILTHYMHLEFDNLVQSTDQVKYSDRKLRIESGGNEIPEEV
jgi:hypothetical protein